MSSESRTNKFAKLWYVEASTYSFSVNLSLGLMNAFVIKILGYGLPELGYLTVLRTLAVFISQPLAAFLTLFYRKHRKTIWFVAGAVNRILWAMVPVSLLFPGDRGLVYLASLTFIAQFAGGLAGVAAMDCVGSNIPSAMATKAFGMVNKLSYMSVALSQIAGMVVFLSGLDPLLSYVVIYSTAFLLAMVSTVLLYLIPDDRADLGRNPVVKFESALKVIEDEKLRKYLFVISLFNFSVNIPAPFWDYLVLGVTGGRELFIPVKNMANLLTKYMAVDWWQKQAFKRGLRKTLVEGMAFTTMVPVLYLEVSSAAHVVFAEIVSGVVWAPVDVGTGVYNTYLPPDTVRPVYLSTVNLLVNGMASAAATVGTIIATWTGNVYSCLLVSAAMRVVTAGIAYKVLPEVDRVERRE